MATGEVATKEVATEETPIVEAATELPEVFETIQEAVRLHHIKNIITIVFICQIVYSLVYICSGIKLTTSMQ